MKRQRINVIAIAILLLAAGPAALAAVKPHALFSDGAVLQQGVSVPVWGTAEPGERVTVSIANQKVMDVCEDGKWMVRLKPMKAGGPYTMTISGSNKVEIKNVLVGEVWICSGQSNMEWPLWATENAEQVIAASADPMLRHIKIPHTTSDTPLSDINASWTVCGPETAKDYTAVGYYFARELRKALNVPVGLINSSWGGTMAEPWTSYSAIEADPEFRDILKRLPSKPGDGNVPTVLYNAMIAPLQPYAIKGVIWYQGESNAGRAEKYRRLFPLMIKSWRDAWGLGDFPFLFVQLAPFMDIVTEPQESAWAELRESQLLTTKTCPNTAMAVITDAGDPKDIHPKKKEPVGVRLALAARALAYSEKVAYCGPIYKSMQVRGDRVLLTFDNAESGLEAKGGELTGFTVAGEDGKFYNGRASIVGDKVIVSSPQVAKPVAVRYGWANCPVVNLYNKEGLPASPFRTDDFPLTTFGK